tara:strand:+ start:504 stop:1013 length:510 start_codon:yes stop_codon:yes gene_type:complete
MQSKAATVDAYLAGLPGDRREAIETIRQVILKNLPSGYEEGMLYGMIGYYVPHSIYPDGYHCTQTDPLPFANLASQKNHMSFYGMGIYVDEAQGKWFVGEWKKTSMKLDMGKSCVRFKKLGDVPLEVIGKAIKRMPVKQYIELYEKQLKANSVGKKVSKKRSAAKTKKR